MKCILRYAAKQHSPRRNPDVRAWIRISMYMAAIQIQDIALAAINDMKAIQAAGLMDTSKQRCSTNPRKAAMPYVNIRITNEGATDVTLILI